MRKSLYTPQHEQLCAWLRERRQARGLTVRDLADQLGIDSAKVVRVEHGQTRLDVIEFVAWCVALGASPRAPLSLLWADAMEAAAPAGEGILAEVAEAPGDHYSIRPQERH